MRIPLRFPQLASAIFCLCVALATPSHAQKVERWMNSGFSCEYNMDLTQFNNEGNYPTVLQNIDVVQMFLNDVHNKGPNNPTFAARLALYRKFGIRLAVEGDPALNPTWVVNGQEIDAYCHTVTCNAQIPSGSVGSPDDVAKASAWRMLEKIQPVYDAGGQVDYLALGGFGMARILENTNPQGEGPRFGCSFPEDVAEATLASFMKYIHEGVTHHGVTFRGHPDIKMGLILAWPNIRYGGAEPINPGNDTPSVGGTHFEDVLQRIVNKVKEPAYAETLWFLHLDGGYELAMGYWSRMSAIRNQSAGLNLRFGVLLFPSQDFKPTNNSDYCAESHAADDATYCSKTLNFVHDVQQNVGELDDYLIETYWSPSHDFPESNTDGSDNNTFMNLIKRLATPSDPSFWGYDHGYFRRTDRDIFDWRFYLSSDSNIASFVDQNFGNQKRFGAEWHWLNFGVSQGLRGAWMFSGPAYVNKYPQVGPTSWEGAIDHFFRWGRTYDQRSARQSTISAGLMHSLVQREFYAPKAAGNGGSGQLGNWGTSNSNVPVQVAAGFQTSDVAAGYYDSLAVSTDGTVYAWGNNTYGQLGNNSSGGQANAPNAVPSFGYVITQSGDGMKIVSANWGVCAAVDNTGREESGQFTKGQVWMWGINYDGQLGDGTTTAHYFPKLVLTAPGGAPLNDVMSIAAGSSHTSALKRDGTVVSWGTNVNGALGNGGAGTRSLSPVQVLTGPNEPLNDVVQLACGGSRFCVAVRNDGTVWGWGANGSGQLGVGDTTDRPYATQIPNFGSIDKISAGQYHTVAHSWGDRRVYAWGYNGYGQLGRSGAPLTQTSPFPMDTGPDNMTEITDVAAGGYFSLMIRGRDEKVFVVGDNQSGQLALGDFSARSVPRLSLY